MGRTQVYLGDEELGLLDRAAAETGASRSELIRRAIRTTFGERSHEASLETLRTMIRVVQPPYSTDEP